MPAKKLPETVPAHAKMLLDFIGDIEAPQGYNTIYGNNQRHLKKQITQMTLGEVIDAQKGWMAVYGSSAAGRYQFMRRTLIDIANEISTLRGDLLFRPALQDRLGYYLLLRRGYAAFVAGKIDIVEFGKQLAMEWASFPVLAGMPGAHRDIRTGQSYYAGDGVNKALVEPHRVEAKLKECLALAKTELFPPQDTPESEAGGTGNPAGPAQGNPDPENLDKPLLKSKSVWMWITTALGAPVAAFSGLDWRVQLVIVAVIVGFAVYAIKRRADIAKVYRDLKSEVSS